MNNTTRIRVLIAVLAVAGAWLAAPGPLFAQDDFEFKLFRPVVSVSVIGEPDADFKDVDGQYGASGAMVATNIPLGGVHLHPQGKVLGHQVFLTAGFGTTSQRFDTPFVDREPRLYNGVVAGSVLFASRKGNFYYGSAGASFAEEQDTVGSPSPRPYALGMGTYRTSHTMMLVYGGAFTYLYGRGLLLPAFGIVYTPNTTWTISGAVPFSWRFTQKLTDSLRMNYLIWVSGQQYRFNNDDNFPGQDSKVYERVRERHLGAEIEYRATPDIALLGQVGVSGGRRLGFANAGESEFAASDINAVPYIKLTARFLIGKSLFDQAADRGAAVGNTP
jgi:hypothetical protein